MERDDLLIAELSGQTAGLVARLTRCEADAQRRAVIADQCVHIGAQPTPRVADRLVLPDGLL